MTCSETVSWARAACGVPVGRYIDRPGSSSTSSTPSGAVHLPLLGAGGLEDEDVVGVGVHGEALRAGRGEVGVGLAGVAELELELGDQPGQRRPVAVQALEDDVAPSSKSASALRGVDQAGERACRPAWRRGCTTTPAAPRRPGPAGSLGVRIADEVSSWSASSSESSPTRSSGSVRCRCTRDAQTFVEEGLGVTAEQVESAQDASPSVRSFWSPSTRRCRCRRSRCRRVGAVGVGGVAVGGVGRVAVRGVAVGAVGVGAVGCRCRRRRCRPRRRSRGRRRPAAAVVMSSSLRGSSGVVVMRPPGWGWEVRGEGADPLGQSAARGRAGQGDRCALTGPVVPTARPRTRPPACRSRSRAALPPGRAGGDADADLPGAARRS